MKIFLINPNLVNPLAKFVVKDEGTFLNEIFPSTGINMLATILRGCGHEVKVADHLMCFLETKRKEIDFFHWVEKILLCERFNLVGITTITNTRHASFDLARMAKKYGNTVVVGGPHSIMHDQILKLYDFVDFVIVGEGEKSLLNLASCLSGEMQFNALKGVAFRGDDGIKYIPEEIINLDDYSPPDYSSYFKFSAKPQKISMVSERGCHGCAYCQNYWGRVMRSKSAEKIISEIDEYVQKYEIRRLTFQDDNFTFDKSRAIKILNGIAHLRLEIDMVARADFIDEELAAVMKGAGVKSVFLGVETGSEKIRVEKMGKNLTDKHIQQAVRFLKEQGIFTCGYVMLGYPEETDADITTTYYFLKNLKLDRINCSITHINAFSPLYRQMLSQGLINGVEEWEDENRSRIYLHSRERLAVLLAIREIFLREFCAIGRAHEHYTALEYSEDWRFTNEELVTAEIKAKEILGKR